MHGGNGNADGQVRMGANTLLIGYYGEMNTGDDALYAVSAWGMRHYFSDRKVFCYTEHLPNVPGAEVIPAFRHKRFPGHNLLRAAWLNRRLSQVVYGGGSIFFNANTLRYWCNLLDRIRSDCHFAAGVSVGPFASQADEVACTELLKRLAFIGLRDAVSLARVRDLCPSLRAELTFDLAPLLWVSSVAPAEPPVRRGLGIALCHYERFTGGETAREAQRLTRLADTLRAAAKRDLLDELVLIDFNGHPTMGDTPVHRELLERLDGCLPVRHLGYKENPYEVLRTVQSLRGIIAMRLHAAVFAFCAQTPHVVLAYHEKCRGWARMTGLPEDLMHDATDFDQEMLINSLFKLYLENPPLPALPRDEAITRALRNWSWQQK